MRFAFLFVSTICLMLTSACSDDAEPPVQDMKVVVDTKGVVDTKATPDVAKPDTQAVVDQKGGDVVPHFDFTVGKCAVEVNLSGKEPCLCGTTLVYDVKTQYPTCVSPKVVKCCPLDGKPKCE